MRDIINLERMNFFELFLWVIFMYDIIIVGAGPAGMTAAIYALRANKKVLLLEAKAYGGQIVNAYRVENYPGISSISGFDLANNMYNQVKSFGVDIKFEEVIGIQKYKVITANNEYKTKAIILATGVQNKKLNLENEDKFIGRGISYCATCDGNFYKNKRVAVIGGGNTALEDAIYLSSIASEVYLIHRRDSFRGDDRLLDDVKRLDNIKIITNSKVTNIFGNNCLSGIEIADDTSNKSKIDIDGLFIAIGQEPKNNIFSDIIDIDQYGYIISPDGVHTSCDGIYVAGDARVKDLRQLTTAVSDGSIAANVAIKEIN